MKIRFLGTSAGWPLPRLGCKCEICSSKDPKDTRTRTQILIDDSTLLDAGPETYSHLLPLNVAQKIKALLISHAHPDHILGLWDLPHIYGRKENNVDKIKLYITQTVLNSIKNTFFSQFQPIEVKVVKPNEAFNIGNSKVTYIPVIHGKTPAFAIKFKDGKIFTYITDFNRILPSAQTMIRHSHVLALDGSSLDKIGQGPSHISIKDGITIGKNLKAKMVYFIHIGHKTGTHEFLENYLRKNAPANFHIAYDNLELQI